MSGAVRIRMVAFSYEGPASTAIALLGAALGAELEQIPHCEECSHFNQDDSHACGCGCSVCKDARATAAALELELELEDA